MSYALHNGVFVPIFEDKRLYMGRGRRTDHGSTSMCMREAGVGGVLWCLRYRYIYGRDVFKSLGG